MSSSSPQTPGQGLWDRMLEVERPRKEHEQTCSACLAHARQFRDHVRACWDCREGLQRLAPGRMCEAGTALVQFCPEWHRLAEERHAAMAALAEEARNVP